ncbi:glycosyltransferase family 4 protein [Actinoplanes subtropicus]|uniref:glycosyltransferase family 4 protein n=1 Tax=Actinoplanes subtropicus TaxID=543632 RepID=UPI00068E0367|nr:glycosyltransferase family 4 protein [Actinoplanes subtropicus]
MRVAHVTDVYLPRLGGVELQVSDLAAHQRRRGDNSLVITTTEGGDQLGDVPVLRLGAGRRLAAGPHRRVPAAELSGVLRVCAAELVHVHISAFSPLSWTAARVAAANGLPTVISVHSMWHDILPLVRRYARRQRAASWPVEWTAVSTAAAQAVSAALDGAVVGVLPNGIDPGDWQTVGPPAEPPVPTLVSVMRMVRRKRPQALLDILLALHASHPARFRAVLVGDGPHLPRLRRRVDASGSAGAIHLAGALSRPAIRGILSDAQLYVAPAPRESFGIAALEARTAGLPVVARAGTGIADFIRPEVEGWLVGSDAMLATTIAGLLDDPARLAAVAAHNRSTTPAMSWPAVLGAADAIYEAAIRRQTGPLLRHTAGQPG